MFAVIILQQIILNDDNTKASCFELLLKHLLQRPIKSRIISFKSSKQYLSP